MSRSDTSPTASLEPETQPSSVENKRKHEELDLSRLPAIYLLPGRLSSTELSNVEDQIRGYGGLLVREPVEARLFLGKVGTRQRAEFELRCRGVWTVWIEPPKIIISLDSQSTEDGQSGPPRKRQKVSNVAAGREVKTEVIVLGDSSTESEPEAEPAASVPAAKSSASTPPAPAASDPGRSLNLASELISESQSASRLTTGPESSNEILSMSAAGNPRPDDLPEVTRSSTPEGSPHKDIFKDEIKVIKLDWLLESVKAGTLLPPDSFVVYTGRLVEPPKAAQPAEEAKATDAPAERGPRATTPRKKSPTLRQGEFREILERAKADASATPSRRGPPHFGSGRSYLSSQRHTTPVKKSPQLLHRTTSEHDEDVGGEMLDLPDWVKEGKVYSCERVTLPDPPNQVFIEELRKIKMARLLHGDEIGVRAYSTSIASIAAFPRPLASTREVLALPGCDHKIAHLYHEWKTNDGRIPEVEEIENDEVLKILRQFYEIWGVGPTTAREFYYERGWRDLDDVIEFGWDTLSRVQQIGLKYYDDFLEKIPRDEVESIAATVLEHARKVRDDGIECCIVGGYRRGKAFSGDVDLILSHRDESKTLNLVSDVVGSLVKEGWITHTLLLSLTGTKRDQQTLAWRPDSAAGHGFDTLDKALVVWQDINYEKVAGGANGEVQGEGHEQGQEQSREQGQEQGQEHEEGQEQTDGQEEPPKNPNVHRRVDIIISPWSTVGCAITGWSGETTFQRDLRRYARKTHFWKFDSSGIRDRATGHVVDLEGRGGVSRTWAEAERKVFEGMGLVYREPWERCTG